MAGVFFQAAGEAGTIIGQIGLNIGGAAVVGGIVGWALKKVLKVLAVVIGVELAVLAYLHQQGFITVRWDQLNTGLTGVTIPATQPVPTWLPTVSSLGVGTGFVAGALVGFNRG